MLRRTFLIAFTFATLLAASLTTTVSAQGTFGALPDPISSRDLNNYADRLGLSDQQMLAIGEPHVRYLEQFRVLREGDMQRLMDQFRGMRMGFDPAQISRMASILQDYNRLLNRIRSLDEQFLNEMQMLLTAEQAEMLPRLRMQRERSRYMGEAMRFTDFINPAVRVDLSTMIEQLELPPDQLEAIDPLLAQYEHRLTSNARRIYEATQKMFTDGIKRFEQLGFTEDAMNDRAQMMRMFGAVQEIWGEVSKDMLKEAGDLTNLHRSTFKQFALLLPEDSARLLRERYYSRAYPQAAAIGRESEAHFTAALEMETLPDDLRGGISALSRSHMSTQDRVAEQVIDLLEQRRRNMSLMQMANMGEDPVRLRIEELTTQAETADQTAIQTLKALLGPELASQLRPTPMTTVRSSRIAAMRAQAGAGRGERGGDRGRGAGRGGPPGGSPWMMGRSATDFLTETRPPDRINANDLREYARQLNLNASQQTILGSLHEDYLERFESIRRELALPYAHVVEQLRSRDSDRSREETADLIERGLDLLEQLTEAVHAEDERFFADARIAVIDSRNEQQANGLRSLELARERMMYRTPEERTGGGQFGFGGVASEARVDLALLVPSISLEPADMQSTVEVLAEYEMNTTDQLRQRFLSELSIHRASSEFMRIPPGGFDRDEVRQRSREAGQRMGEVRAAANVINEALRTMNRQTLAALVDALPDSAATQLRDAYYRQAYPNVFDDPDSADAKIQLALALSDLSESQRSQLFEIAADFRPVYHDLTQRILNHHLALADMPMPGGQMVRGGGGGNWAERAEHMNALGVLNFDRTELNERTMRQLRSVLSPTQIEQLSQAANNRRDQARG